MALLSIFKRTGDPAPEAESGDAVQQARTRARRRLIGAAVLLVIGVIGFPLVFETRPRPIPIDIPIEIPKKEGAPALAMPPARPAASAVLAPLPPVGKAPADEAVITESRSDAGREVGPRASTPVAAAMPVTAAAKPVASAAPEPKPAAKPASAAAAARAVASAGGDGARAKALLEGSAPGPAAEGTRFVVQVGAFAEAEAARETRTKVEKLGMKTYTQVAQTPSGSRIRVRVGPFASRAEADAALAKARAAGLNAVVLTL